MQWSGSGCTGRPLLLDRSQASARALQRSTIDGQRWRLPRVNELRRLVNKNATPPGLDAQLFEAYNRCDLDAFRALLADDLEFYHDQGGLMLGPEAVTEATRKYICGKVRRELVPGTLEVDRIEGYGAIELGSHRFCEVATG